MQTQVALSVTFCDTQTLREIVTW